MRNVLDAAGLNPDEGAIGGLDARIQSDLFN